MYASRGLGRGEGNGDPRIEGGNPAPSGGVPPREGVGVDPLANCHRAGEALRTMVWVLRSGDDAGDVLVRCRHSTSRTSFSSALPSNGGDAFCAMRSEMRSAWSSSRMSLSISGAVSRAVPRPPEDSAQLPTLKNDQAFVEKVVRYHWGTKRVVFVESFV